MSDKDRHSDRDGKSELETRRRNSKGRDESPLRDTYKERKNRERSPYDRKRVHRDRSPYDRDKRRD